jgi:hypothetical protein
MRLAIAFAVVLAAVLAPGCGSSSEDASTGIETQAPARGDASGAPVGAAAKACETTDAEGLRATGASCRQARRVMSGWRQKGACSSSSGASRVSCSSRSYRCTGARTDRGIAVSCSRLGRSVAFLAKR